MSRRDNAASRCPRCQMLGALCVCALVPTPPLVTRTRLVLFLHRDEARKPTNTGQLAAACVAASEVIVRGHEGQPSAPFVAAPGTRPVLLFPDDDAVPLAASDEPVTLIVPDGTWRQAARVRARVPGLRDLPCAVLPPGPPSRYQLRSEPRPGGLATLEAIARAFALLGDVEASAAMERVFAAAVERTLWSRGAITTAQLEFGLPDGVELHRRY
jgi:DTW domain-containing protein YfiP